MYVECTRAVAEFFLSIYIYSLVAVPNAAEPLNYHVLYTVIYIYFQVAVPSSTEYINSPSL